MAKIFTPCPDFIKIYKGFCYTSYIKMPLVLKINVNTDAGQHFVIKLFCKHKTYLHNNPVCLCVYARKTPESGSSVVISTRQYRILLNKCGLSMSLLVNWTLGYAHTHTGLLCICVYRIHQ